MDRMFDWLIGHGKPLRAKVTTMDADLNAISMDRDALGQHLFDTVCKIIGLREVWYFGLCFTNRKGFTCWLQLDKKIRQHPVPKQSDGSFHFLFLVKFFPESVKAELIQDLTKHLFFLQIRQSILSMDLYCPSEAAILLASYAVQAMNGDYQNADGGGGGGSSAGVELDLDKLIPKSVIEQYEMSSELWNEKICNWWANNGGLSREDAQEEFLCIAEELDMYGLSYYPIRNQRGTELLLGVSAQGLGIYEPDNKLSPRPFFPWTEIKCISFKNKMFTICTADKSKIRFRAEDMSINQSLLDLCVGTHNLYLRRRQPDLLEVQQMRIQAQEQRQRRFAEQTRLQREREQRVQAETERDKLRTELGNLSEQFSTLQTVMKSAEESHQLVAERARVSEQELLDMARRANDAETEMQRIKISHLRAEERKIALERKCQDAELLAHRLFQHRQHKLMNKQQQQQQQNGVGGQPPPPMPKDFLPPPPYHEQLRRSNVVTSGGTTNIGRYAPLLNNNSSSIDDDEGGGGGEGLLESNDDDGDDEGVVMNGVFVMNESGGGGGLGPPPPLPVGSPPKSSSKFTKLVSASQKRINQQQQQQRLQNAEMNGGENGGGVVGGGGASLEHQRQSINAELKNIYAELERSRGDWKEKDQSLREKLANFRVELESLKREGTDTENDRLFAQKLVVTGCFDKHSTLRKSGAGSSKSRAKFFDEMTSAAAASSNANNNNNKSSSTATNTSTTTNSNNNNANENTNL